MTTPKIDPKWRTETVVALCQSMRQTNDYSALPILADALQDADCTDDGLLTVLRYSEPLEVTYKERLVAEVMSVETEAAVLLVERMGAEIGVRGNYDQYEEDADGNEIERPHVPMSYEALIEAAWVYIEHGQPVYMGTNENYKRAFWPRKDQFWDAYALITGVHPHKKDRQSFFSCGC